MVRNSENISSIDQQPPVTMCAVCISLYNVQHSTPRNSSDNLPPIRKLLVAFIIAQMGDGLTDESFLLTFQNCPKVAACSKYCARQRKYAMQERAIIETLPLVLLLVSHVRPHLCLADYGQTWMSSTKQEVHNIVLSS